MNKAHYIVVRTYDDGATNTSVLQNAFDQGYEFVRASEYVPEAIHNSNRRYGYTEYILKKELDASYDAQLKSDMLSMLNDMLIQVSNFRRCNEEEDFYDCKFNCESMIQSRINKLKGDCDETDT